MSTPPAPPHDELIDRKFSFYPPILGVEHNEWVLKEATWSEMVVRNTKTGLDVAVPRRFFGSVSQVEEPVVIVGLTKELSYRTGAVWPTERKLFSMPEPPLKMAAHGEHTPPKPGEPTGLGAIMGSGVSGTEGRMAKLIGVAFLSVVVVAALVWALVYFTPEARPTYVAKDQSYLELTRDDDYFAVVRKLGRPKEDRWKAATGELQFRALVYPDRGYNVIMMGSDRDSTRYIGAVGVSKSGQEWTPLHSVQSARGTSTAALLRSLKPF